jgi:hypothetical protein
MNKEKNNMARLVLTNVDVTVAGVSLSDHVASVTIQSTYDVVETTAFAGGNVPNAAKTRQAGLVDNSVTLEFHQDFAAGEVEATIYPLLGTVAEIKVQPVNAAVAADNPQYVFNAVISEWTPLNGAVGELATASVTWPVTGSITKDVTP